MALDTLSKGLIQQVSGSTTSSTTSTTEKTALYAASRAVGAATTAAVVGIRMAEEALGVRFDPAPSYLFYIELSGVIVGLFTECDGLELERSVDTIKEGGANNFEHQLPGRVKQSNITLKRGLTVSPALWDWFMQGRHDFDVKRINFSIIQGAPSHNYLTWAGVGDWMGGGSGFGKIKHWDVENAFPIKWEASSLKASDSNSVVIETLKIAHHGLSLSIVETGLPMSLAASGMGLI